MAIAASMRCWVMPAGRSACRRWSALAAGGSQGSKRQPKRRRLWLGDGSCIRLRPRHRGHVWSYDFVEDQTHNGRKYRMLNIIDEFSRECLAMVPLRRFRSDDVIDVLADLFIEHGPPEHIRSDKGPEFVASAVREWLGRLGVTTLYIEPGSPWENGYIESFNARLRHELLNGEIFYSLGEVRIVTGWWRELQPGAPTQQPRLPSASAGNDQDASLASRLRCAPPPGQAGIEGAHQLTTQPDQSSRGVQCSSARSRFASDTSRPPYLAFQL
jgi:transposase InsO family protein